MPTYEQLGFGQGAALSGDRARTMFGHVMGLVAVTMAFAALGAYVTRNMNQGLGTFLIFYIGAFACIFGLNSAAARGNEQLAVALLFGLGLLLGMAISPTIVYYAHTDPGVVYQAAGSTAIFVGIMGSFGYLTRTDLSRFLKPVLIACLVVLVAGLIAILLSVPGASVVYCILMLAIFGFFTAFDFQRLARKPTYTSAVPIAAGIFLDILNVFLLFLRLFGGSGGR